MKKIALTISALIVVALMVSTATAVPVANSQPTMEKIEKINSVIESRQKVINAIQRIFHHSYLVSSHLR